MAEYLPDTAPNRGKIPRNFVLSAAVGVAMFFVLLFALLFACGLWSPGAEQASAAPQFNVRVVGGALPGVVVEQETLAAKTT